MENKICTPEQYPAEPTYRNQSQAWKHKSLLRPSVSLQKKKKNIPRIIFINPTEYLEVLNNYPI